MSEEKKDDPMVVDFINASYSEAGARGLTYAQLCQAVERLHLTALFYRFLGDGGEVADYLVTYGEQVAGMIESGTLQFVGEIQKPMAVH